MSISLSEGAESMNWARTEHASSESKLAESYMYIFKSVGRQLDSQKHDSKSIVISLEKSLPERCSS